jgi:hypothetical protein
MSNKKLNESGKGESKFQSVSSMPFSKFIENSSVQKSSKIDIVHLSDETERKQYATLADGKDDEENLRLIMEFDKKFSGLESISGGGAKWKKTLNSILTLCGATDFPSMNRKQKWTFYKVIITCIVFLEKPLDLLAVGVSKSTTAVAQGRSRTRMTDRDEIMKGKRNTYIDSGLSQYLPMLTDDDKKSWTKTQLSEFESSRHAIKNTVFYNVNMSDAKRVALLGLEYLGQSAKAPAIRQWYDRYKAKPSDLDEESLYQLGLRNDEHCKDGKGSLYVKSTQMQDFASAKHIWEKPEFSEAFSVLR